MLYIDTSVKQIPRYADHSQLTFARATLVISPFAPIMERRSPASTAA